MDKATYITTFDGIGYLASIAAGLPLHEVREAVRDMMAVGPSIEPTQYRENGWRLELQKRVLDAIIAFDEEYTNCVAQQEAVLRNATQEGTSDD